MNQTRVAPYGSWKSPITSDVIVTGTVGLGRIALDGEDIYWSELRPSEGGRVCIVRRTPDSSVYDMTPAGFNARTRVHEYGGGAYTIAGGVVYFSNFADHRLYQTSHADDAAPRPLTPPVDLRYADYVYDARRRRLVAVREDHTEAGREAVTTIVSVRVRDNAEKDVDRNAGESAQDGEPGDVLVEGHDFYSSPRISPDGKLLAWLAWNHPNMPWDGCELWVGELAEDGSLRRKRKVAGGVDESIFQPEWSPDGQLYFVSDRSGWWNLYRIGGDASMSFEREDETLAAEPLCEMAAEFGLPQWVFGTVTYAFASPERIICTYGERGTWRLASLDTTTLKLETIEIPYTEFGSILADGERAFFIGGSPTQKATVVEFNLATRELTTLRHSASTEVDAEYLSTPEPIEYPTEDGLTAHAIFYRPRNRDFVATEGERPPLLVKCHGGPTSAASTTLRLEIQYWTSRGIAVLDVNYGGSTGYGRAYRQRLDGRWGIVDIDDCVNGARFLAARGEVDGERCAITGGSAGGYTVLGALTFRDFFKAGASHYGVSDLAALARETHKFESRYLDRLIGPYPERADLYEARAPINFTDRLACPVIFFQGLEDEVVPPNQAEMMVDALRAKGLPVAYVPFEGEQHGFRRAENIKRALDGELYFYSKVFGFELADAVEPVHIENLEK
ncbi:MAG TPA: S9 family peptidase [Pyrinomonadaceae bacterium]|jgi:dipeptidyl aminopeptidase/acylaminoacyl peptidase